MLNSEQLESGSANTADGSNALRRTASCTKISLQAVTVVDRHQDASEVKKEISPRIATISRCVLCCDRCAIQRKRFALFVLYCVSAIKNLLAAIKRPCVRTCDDEYLPFAISPRANYAEAASSSAVEAFIYYNLPDLMIFTVCGSRSDNDCDVDESVSAWIKVSLFLIVFSLTFFDQCLQIFIGKKNKASGISRQNEFIDLFERRKGVENIFPRILERECRVGCLENDAALILSSVINYTSRVVRGISYSMLLVALFFLANMYQHSVEPGEWDPDKHFSHSDVWAPFVVVAIIKIALKCKGPVDAKVSQLGDGISALRLGEGAVTVSK